MTTDSQHYALERPRGTRPGRFRADCAIGAHPTPNLRPCSEEDAPRLEIYMNTHQARACTFYVATQGFAQQTPTGPTMAGVCTQHSHPFVNDIEARITDLMNKAQAARIRADEATLQVDREWHEASARWLRRRAQAVARYPHESKTADYPALDAPSEEMVMPLAAD